MWAPGTEAPAQCKIIQARGPCREPRLHKYLSSARCDVSNPRPVSPASLCLPSSLSFCLLLLTMLAKKQKPRHECKWDFIRFADWHDIVATVPTDITWIYLLVHWLSSNFFFFKVQPKGRLWFDVSVGGEDEGGGGCHSARRLDQWSGVAKKRPAERYWYVLQIIPDDGRCDCEARLWGQLVVWWLTDTILLRVLISPFPHNGIRGTPGK